MAIHNSVKKPLWRSIFFCCAVFIVVLCCVLGLTSYFSYHKALYDRYEAYITDILHYVDRHIDDDDLAQCVKTLNRSAKFDELEKFMDGVKEDFDIHYLYIILPVHKNGSRKIMSVISAENYYDRYIDTEGNLYLGWISDDEYEEETVEELFGLMKQKEITFHEEQTEWGLDYTGTLPLYDSNNNPYALLCVDVDVSHISTLVRHRTYDTYAFVVLLGALFMAAFLLWMRLNVTNPIRNLEESVVSFASKSSGKRNVQELNFDMPRFKIKNEVSKLAEAVNQMTVDMRNYVEGILLAERNTEIMKRHAAHMSELANQDSLTGIRNKTSYDNYIRKMDYELDMGILRKFGIAMIDLNYLKKINDTYGHEQGNMAIKNLCSLICEVFEHSPVFRIGGDEFVVILKEADYDNIRPLIMNFKARIEKLASDNSLEPWERVSAAIGYAAYDSNADMNVLTVFERADKAMYEAKTEMKAGR